MGVGIKPFRDPALVDDFAAPRLPLDVTKDHTYAQLLVDTGQIALRDVAGSGLGHVLTNALGGSVDDVIVDVDLLRLQDGDRLLLCSDGLTDHLDDESIAATMLAARTSSEACARLTEGALERGGRDNVTLIVAAYVIPSDVV